MVKSACFFWCHTMKALAWKILLSLALALICEWCQTNRLLHSFSPFLYLVFLFFWGYVYDLLLVDRVLLCSRGYPRTHNSPFYPSLSSSWILGMSHCACLFIFFKQIYWAPTMCEAFFPPERIVVPRVDNTPALTLEWSSVVCWSPARLPL